jgi:predicted phosphoadenosine phosphosulfate sulfurtransferase
VHIWLNENVLEAAQRRISWLFDEFEQVVVNVSGGKDSTVVFHLTLEEARRRGRLPLTAYWIDQEAEWRAAVDMVREWMSHPDVQPMWLQVPFRIFNATSNADHWLHAWDPAAEDLWVHPRDPAALTDNVYGTDRFAELFRRVIAYHFDGVSVAQIAGVRAEESPVRRMGLTGHETYGGETWGRRHEYQPRHFTFYPIYDWNYPDVWKAIHDHGWRYCRLYDLQYQYGIGIRNMRVSNLHHETALESLFYLQEFEPDTYERLAARIGGIDMAGKLGGDDYYVDEVPSMFDGWEDYRDYLLEHLIDDPKWKVRMATRFARGKERFHPTVHPGMFKVHVRSILAHDWEGIIVENWERSVPVHLQTERAEKNAAKAARAVKAAEAAEAVL